MKRLFLQFAFLGAFALEVGCGASASPTSSTDPNPVASSSPSGSQSLKLVPEPPPGCEPWPVQLADMFAKLPLPEGLCLKRDNEPRSSEYLPWTREVFLRQDGNRYGDLARLSHELCHAHQHWAILNAGHPDIVPPNRDGPTFFLKYLQGTQEGLEYMAVGGYTFLNLGGECTRASLPACWAVDRTRCEESGAGGTFCMPPQTNPYEDNAEFCARWYDPGATFGLGPARLVTATPRRAGWASGTGSGMSNVWLP